VDHATPVTSTCQERRHNRERKRTHDTLEDAARLVTGEQSRGCRQARVRTHTIVSLCNCICTVLGMAASELAHDALRALAVTLDSAVAASRMNRATWTPVWARAWLLRRQRASAPKWARPKVLKVLRALSTLPGPH
jgi:hypothetical protein